MNRDEKVYAIQHHVEAIMSILNIKSSDSTRDTPKRVAKMYVDELFSSMDSDADLDNKMCMFAVEQSIGGTLIELKDIPFYSMCEHHLLPFFGKVDVTYKAEAKVIGLSKIPRIVKHFSKRPQLQETLTRDIAEYLDKTLNLEKVDITVRVHGVRHMCMSMRGIESEGTTDTTYTIRR